MHVEDFDAPCNFIKTSALSMTRLNMLIVLVQNKTVENVKACFWIPIEACRRLLSLSTVHKFINSRIKINYQQEVSKSRMHGSKIGFNRRYELLANFYIDDTRP